MSLEHLLMESWSSCLFVKHKLDPVLTCHIRCLQHQELTPASGTTLTCRPIAGIDCFQAPNSFLTKNDFFLLLGIRSAPLHPHPISFELILNVLSSLSHVFENSVLPENQQLHLFLLNSLIRELSALV